MTAIIELAGVECKQKMTRDEVYERLRRAGWPIGEVAGCRVWLVTGEKGDETLIASGATQTQVCYRALNFVVPGAGCCEYLRVRS